MKVNREIHVKDTGTPVNDRSLAEVFADMILKQKEQEKQEENTEEE